MTRIVTILCLFLLAACAKKPFIKGVEESPKRDKVFTTLKKSGRIPRQDIEPPEPIAEPLGSMKVYFPLNSSEISMIDLGIISGWAERFKASTGNAEIIGHACPLGKAAYNYSLGMQRAQAVKSVLVDMGVAPERIRTLSRGETEPEQTNPDDYQLNRRVIMEVVK
jgi:outer membrane protein OmpA-like peptidoglycan-associated protein